jgi:hypothetical protein
MKTKWRTTMRETPQEELKRNREFALIAFHAAHGAADMLEIAQQMQGDAEEDAHEEGCSCIEDAGRLIDDARCLCVGLVHQIDSLWKYLKSLEAESTQSAQELDASAAPGVVQ